MKNVRRSTETTEENQGVLITIFTADHKTTFMTHIFAKLARQGTKRRKNKIVFIFR